MTTRKKSDSGGKYSELELNMYRARRIAAGIEDDDLKPCDREFLIWALREIGEGEDANAVFGVKAKRGEKKSLESRKTADRIVFVLPWISSVLPCGQGVWLL